MLSFNTLVSSELITIFKNHCTLCSVNIFLKTVAGRFMVKGSDQTDDCARVYFVS